MLKQSAVYVIVYNKYLEAVMDAENNFIENLVENVEIQRCLYDKNDGFYYNRTVRERAWKEVSANCLRSVEDCKHRWKLLRERFVKEIKKMDASLDGGMPYLDRWKYLHSLMFLKESLTRRRVRDNVQEVDVDSVLNHSVLSGDSIVDPLTPVPASTKRAKVSLDNIYHKFGETLERMEKRIPSGPDGSTLDDAFLNTVNCLMKELPEPVKEEFQSRMLQELYKLRRETRDSSNRIRVEKYLLSSSKTGCKAEFDKRYANSSRVQKKEK